MCLWPESTLLEEASLILLRTRHILGISSACCLHKQRDSGSCCCRLLSALERPCRRRRLQGAGQKQVFLSQGKRDIAAPGMKTITFVRLLCEETKFRLSLQQLAREHAGRCRTFHLEWREAREVDLLQWRCGAFQGGKSQILLNVCLFCCTSFLFPALGIVGTDPRIHFCTSRLWTLCKSA